MYGKPLSCLSRVRCRACLIVAVGMATALFVLPAGSTSAQDTVDQLKADYPDWKYVFIPVPKHLQGRIPEMKGKILVQGVFRGDKPLDAAEPLDAAGNTVRNRTSLTGTRATDQKKQSSL